MTISRRSRKLCLSILYPHYIRPIPSMSIVQFHVDPEQGKVPGGIRIPRLTPMFSKPVGGVPCKFRSGLRHGALACGSRCGGVEDSGSIAARNQGARIARSATVGIALHARCRISRSSTWIRCGSI